MLILLIIADSLRNSGFNKQSFWLAGNDLEKEVDWRWATTGQVVSFRNWQYGQPNNAKGGQNCMLYIYPAMLWRDGRCSNKNFPLCELYWLTQLYAYTVYMDIWKLWMIHYFCFPWSAFHPCKSRGSGIWSMVHGIWYWSVLHNKWFAFEIYSNVQRNLRNRDSYFIYSHYFVTMGTKGC